MQEKIDCPLFFFSRQLSRTRVYVCAKKCTFQIAGLCLEQERKKKSAHFLHNLTGDTERFNPYPVLYIDQSMGYE